MLIFCPVSRELYIILAAIFRLGLIGVFVDPGAEIDHVNRACSLCAPEALVAISEVHLPRLQSAALRRIPLKFAVGFPVPAQFPWPEPAAWRPMSRFPLAQGKPPPF